MKDTTSTEIAMNPPTSTSESTATTTPVKQSQPSTKTSENKPPKVDVQQLLEDDDDDEDDDDPEDGEYDDSDADYAEESKSSSAKASLIPQSPSSPPSLENSSVADSTTSSAMSIESDALQVVAAAAEQRAADELNNAKSNASYQVPSSPSTNGRMHTINSTLFVIYMPKSNYKRFVISDRNVTILRSGSATSPIDYNSTSSKVNYSVNVDDIKHCLAVNNVQYNPTGIWTDLTDNGHKFIRRTMSDFSRASVAEDALDGEKDIRNGVWFNILDKPYIPVHPISHSVIGEGFAALITLDLGDMKPADTKNATPTNSGNMENMPVQAILSGRAIDSQRRKVRPVESIGEMLDRIAEYQYIRATVKSKNKACEKLGYSKGTINAYREKVKQALSVGIDLNAHRKIKYRDFKRLIASVHSNSKVAPPKSIATLDKDVGVYDNRFGEISVALMDAQDARGRKKRKPEDIGSYVSSSSGNSSDDEERMRRRKHRHRKDSITSTLSSGVVRAGSSGVNRVSASIPVAAVPAGANGTWQHQTSQPLVHSAMAIMSQPMLINMSHQNTPANGTIPVSVTSTGSPQSRPQISQPIPQQIIQPTPQSFQTYAARVSQPSMTYVISPQAPPQQTQLLQPQSHSTGYAMAAPSTVSGYTVSTPFKGYSQPTQFLQTSGQPQQIVMNGQIQYAYQQPITHYIN